MRDFELLLRVCAPSDNADGDLQVDFRAGFDGSVPPLQIMVTARDGDYELVFSLSSHEVRALRALCDLSLALPLKDAEGGA